MREPLDIHQIGDRRIRRRTALDLLKTMGRRIAPQLDRAS